jgi:Peptidase family C25/Propeptide_C25/Secretion system C-terminal sorting domain
MMKSKFILLVALTMIVSMVFAQSTNFKDSWGKQGFTLKKQSETGLTVNHSVQQFSLVDTEIKGEIMKTVLTKGQFLPNNAGAPNLPGEGRYVAVPVGATAKVNILNMRTEKYSNVNIAPAPVIPLDTDKSPLKYEKDSKIYSENKFYPENPVQLSDPTKLRGLDVVMLGITPFQYNPVTKELIVYRDIEIEVEFIGGNGHFGEDRLRSRSFDQILGNSVMNCASLEKINYDQRILNQRSDEGCEYLIVSPDGAEFQQWADSIRMFRIQQGITTEIVTISEIGNNNAITLENYFNNAYNTWTTPPTAVLLLGDYGSDPNTQVMSPIWDNYCVSDNIYADVNGNSMPDMVFARITARNASELEVMVTKFIHHERNPPTSAYYYDHPITALGWQTERWFQICSETVGGYFKNVHGKDPIRINEIYQGSPGSTWSTATNTSTVVDYFGPNGLGYIPAEPSTLGNWSGGNANDVNNAINAGAFMLQHRDHGGETGWGEPDYSNSDIDGLENTDLTFIFSINCLTGKYNWGNECFTEKFHRYTKDGKNSGALGLIAASEVSYSFVNDTYVWGLFDNMWPDFMPDYGTWFDSAQMRPAFGNAAGKYFLEQSSWPYNTSNKEVTYNLFHHHGGAFLTLYSEVPQPLDILHDGVILAGLDFFTIQADAGAIICLTVGDQIIGTGVGLGAGNPVSISIIPQTMIGSSVRLTLTKSNYFRHSELVPVISSDNPYCIYNSRRIDDSQGNGNGVIDFGELISTSIVISNLGNNPTTNATVELLTSDPYVTLIDGTEFYGAIPANDTMSVNNGFTFQVAGDIPDQHVIVFDVLVTDDTDASWSSLCMMTAAAPIIEIGEMVINDDVGGNGNGKLDPGENVIVQVKNFNSGHCLAHNAIANLSTNCQYVTITNSIDTLGTIGFFGSMNAEFALIVDPDAPIGSIVVSLDYEIVSGEIIEDFLFRNKIGSIIEDWETGDFDKFPWESDGDQPWQIINEYPYAGFYSAKTNPISSGQTCELVIDWEVMYADSISFIRKVSSADNNYLKFYIGGQKKGEWSGTSEGWVKESFYVTPGWKTFKFIYHKMSGTIAGSDCAWLDNIELPSQMTLTANAGPDATSCVETTFACIGGATDYTSIEWSTSGSGSFDDITALSSIYTPSTIDYNNGFVNLTLTATNGSGDVQDDEMLLTFIEEPVAPNMPTGPADVDARIILSSEYNATAVVYADSYEWAIEPADAGTISGDGLVGTVEWNSDYMGTATITVKGINSCGEGEFSEGFAVNVYNSVAINENINGLAINVYPNPSDGTFTVNLSSKLAKSVNIKIYNIVGGLVYQMDNVEVYNELNTSFDLKSYPKGLYFLNIEGQDIKFNKKLIIQ